MERLTTRHCGVAVIKDKSLLKEAMEKLARYEEPITNADKIRSMSDEELADWIHNIDHHFGDDNEPMVGVCDMDTDELVEIYDSYGDLLEWLQEKR